MTEAVATDRQKCLGKSWDKSRDEQRSCIAQSADKHRKD